MLQSWDLRWIIGISLIAIAGIFGMTVLRSLSNVVVAMVLTIQAEVAIRPGYGRADSSGIQIYGTGLLALLVLLILHYQGRSIRWRGHLHRPIVLMLAMSALSLLFTSEHFAGLDFVLFQTQLVLVYVAAMNVVRNEADVRRMVTLLLATLITQAVVYFIQSALNMGFNVTGDTWNLSEELPRPGGTVSANPAGFASYMMPLLLIGIVQLISGSSWRRPWTIAATVLGLVALALTFTRAAWAGFLIGFMYILVFGARYTRIRPRTVAMIVCAAVVVVLALAPLIQRRLSESVGDAYDERAGLMRIAMNVIEAHPVFGVGPGAYSHVFKEYLPPGGMDQWLYTVHNEYLLRAAETGVLGGVAWVWLLLAALRQSRDLLRRSASPEMRAFALAWGAGLLNLAWQMYWVPWRGFGYNALFWFMLGLLEAATMYEWGDPAIALRRDGTPRGAST
ncbi:MAG: O-antigen ligase family protein [Deltaproteobacteria bacterium]|nr:O-antigen ligase family protein [Deltaproteobacteria bacterium]